LENLTKMSNEKNVLKNIDYGMSIILKSCKILFIVFLVVLGAKFYLMINPGHETESSYVSSLPSQNLDHITLVVDDNYDKNSKTILQKIREKFFKEEEQHSRIEYKSERVFIIVNGQYRFLNSEVKKQLCVVYSRKYKDEVDLNKKRVNEVLKNLYC
jgi:hypothetical protein